jgi:hypothetical protein
MSLFKYMTPKDPNISLQWVNDQSAASDPQIRGGERFKEKECSNRGEVVMCNLMMV